MFKKITALILLVSSIFADPLLDLLTLMNVPHNGTHESIVAETQARWIRPAGKERWEIPDLPEKKEKIIEYADQLGFIRERLPSKQRYNYGIVMGATVFRMQKRLHFLIELWKKGIRVEKLVFLTGERPLDPLVESLTDVCKTESQAAHYIWEHAEVPLKMRALPITFIDVPMKGSVRPSTGDTVGAWIKTGPAPGSCLLISNQPYCLYQDAAARKLFPQPFDIETVGEEASLKSLNAAVVLDTIARYLYNSN
jgi:hypothetical protein